MYRGLRACISRCAGVFRSRHLDLSWAAPEIGSDAEEKQSEEGRREDGGGGGSEEGIGIWGDSVVMAPNSKEGEFTRRSSNRENKRPILIRRLSLSEVEIRAPSLLASPLCPPCWK